MFTKMNLMRFPSLNLSNITTTCSFFRNASFSYEGGIRCPGGFKYYPRFPGEEDPPCQPAKLFMIQRIKPVKGNPYWEKKLLKDFRLDGKLSQIAIVKNIPETNARLWKIKHLIKITPITFPYGMPSEEDLGATFLKHTGEMVVSRQIKVDPSRIEAGDEYERSRPLQVVDGKTLRKQLHLKWNNPW